MNDKQKSEGMGPGELTRPIVTAPSAMIELAISKGADLKKLEKILELQERFERNEAKKAYHVAMTAFKADPPEIEKDRHVKFSTSKGVTEYDHASLANVTDKINKGLAEHDLSASWKTNQENGLVTVECIITHSLGHSESTQLSAQSDTSGSKNPIQAIGSTISYLSRYTLLALTGLATSEQDDDGVAGGAEYITEEQVKIIELLAEETNSDVPKWMKVESIDKILAKDFKKAESGLRAKVKKQRQPGE